MGIMHMFVVVSVCLSVCSVKAKPRFVYIEQKLASVFIRP